MHHTAPTSNTSKTPATTPTAIAIVRVFVLLPLETLCGGDVVVGPGAIDVEVREPEVVGVVFPAIATTLGSPRSCFSTLLS